MEKLVYLAVEIRISKSESRNKFEARMSKKLKLSSLWVLKMIRPFKTSIAQPTIWYTSSLKTNSCLFVSIRGSLL